MSVAKFSILLLLTFYSCSIPSFNDQEFISRALDQSFSDSRVNVQFKVSSDWGSGYTTDVIITNKSGTKVSNWNLEWVYSGSSGMSNYWGASISNLSNGYKALPVSYNLSISPNSTVNFGYNSNGRPSDLSISYIKFNGIQIGGLSLPAPSISPVAVLKPVEKYGKLRIQGNKILDKNGQVVQLRGLSSHGLQWFPFTQDKTIDNLALLFKPDVIRVAMYVKEWDSLKGQWSGYLGANPDVKDELIEVVQDAIDAGIYVIVDWHIHWNPSDSANPHWTPNPYTTEAVSFFKEIGNLSYKGIQLKDYSNLIWEVINEPGSGISWSQVKAHANAVISALRNDIQDTDNIILVPAANWAQDLDQVAYDGSGDRPDRKSINIAYTLHFYSSSHGAALRSKAQVALNAGLAVFADEWGSGDYTGNGTPNFNDSQAWIDWMNANSVSWSAWNISDKQETTALFTPGAGLTGPWSSNQLSTTGTWVQAWIGQGR